MFDFDSYLWRHRRENCLSNLGTTLNGVCQQSIHNIWDIVSSWGVGHNQAQFAAWAKAFLEEVDVVGEFGVRIVFIPWEYQKLVILLLRNIPLTVDRVEVNQVGDTDENKGLETKVLTHLDEQGLEMLAPVFKDATDV